MVGLREGTACRGGQKRKEDKGIFNRWGRARDGNISFTRTARVP